MLLLLIVMPLLSIAIELPFESIALEGKFLPAGIIVLFEITLPSLPVVVPVENCIVPVLVVPVDEPSMVQFFTTFNVASVLNLIVEVPATLLVLAFEISKEFPFIFKPLIITLSAPLRSTNGVARVPEIVLAAPPEG